MKETPASPFHDHEWMPKPRKLCDSRVDTPVVCAVCGIDRTPFADDIEAWLQEVQS